MLIKIYNILPSYLTCCRESVRRLVLDPSYFEDMRSFLLIDAASLMVEWSNKPFKRTSIEEELREYQTLAVGLGFRVKVVILV